MPRQFANSLIITYNKNGIKGIHNVFVFNTDSLSNKYHLAIIGKPYIPLIANRNALTNEMTFADSLGNFNANHTKRNLLNYYVNRNIKVIQFLQEQSFIASSDLVVAGHSQKAPLLPLILPTNIKK